MKLLLNCTFLLLFIKTKSKPIRLQKDLFDCKMNCFIFIKKWANPSLFSFIFVFSNTLGTSNRYVKNCPSSILCRDSNSRPLEHESPPITTRPGLPPYDLFLCFYILKLYQLGVDRQTLWSNEEIALVRDHNRPTSKLSVATPLRKGVNNLLGEKESQSLINLRISF